MSIEPLSQKVVAQIKSSATITSLNEVASELLRNSLDASATTIDLTIDYERGACVLEDDGLGIQPSEFYETGGLGKLHHTSKANSEIPVHGGQGTFLASLSAVSLLTITSHHCSHRSHNTLSMHNAEVVLRQIPALPQHHLHFSHGTRVVVHNLFGNMPVRVKQRAINWEKHANSKQWDELIHGVVGLLLPWTTSIRLSIRHAVSSQKVIIRAPSMNPVTEQLNVDRVCSILRQSSIAATKTKSWVSVGASARNLGISGTISVQPCAVKNIQFISFGIKPITTRCSSIFHDEINRLFLDSAFGNIDDSIEYSILEQQTRHVNDRRSKRESYGLKELKIGKKGVDRWPQFFLNIRIRYPGTQNSYSEEESSLYETGESYNRILKLLKAMLWEFLTQNGFRPKQSQRPQDSGKSIETKPGISESYMMHGPNMGNQAVKNSSLERPKNHLDPLGTNVQLPSFREKVPRPESAFCYWTKAKIGAPKPRSLTPKVVEPTDVERPCSAPPMTPNINKHTIPLLAKSGKLIREPFEGLATHSNIPSKVFSNPANGKMNMKTDTAGHILHDYFLAVTNEDELRVWTNPITRKKSLLNQPTGHPVPTHTCESTTAVTHSIRQSIRVTKANDSAASPWIDQIFKKWTNPVFLPAEQQIPRVSSASISPQTGAIMTGRQCYYPEIDTHFAFQEISAGLQHCISKEALFKSHVISQIYRKFILVKLQNGSEDGAGEMLVVIDQHAADERIRIEALLQELCAPVANGASTGINTELLRKSMVFEVSSEEIKLFRKYKDYFAYWGILYHLPASATAVMPPALGKITVLSLPPGIIERCQLQPNILIGLLRTEIWKVHNQGTPLASLPPALVLKPDECRNWLERIHTCPRAIIDLLNSRACRSAIMFNDMLTPDQCENLVQRLAKCMFPWICAHGRPSMVPLVRLQDLSDFSGVEHGAGLGNSAGGVVGFGTKFKKWRSTE